MFTTVDIKTPKGRYLFFAQLKTSLPNIFWKTHYVN